MTTENAKEFLPLVQAMAEGKTVQQKFTHGWGEIKTLDTAEHSPEMFRVKPEPRRIYVLIDTQGRLSGQSFESYPDPPTWLTEVEFIEVLK